MTNINYSNLFTVDADTGIIMNHPSRTHHLVKHNVPMGVVGTDGYLQISILHEGKVYTPKNHRIIWEMCVGPIPEGVQIDHINGIKDDNRLDNLRLCEHGQNSMNRTGWSKRGLPKGVSKSGNSYYGQVQVRKVKYRTDCYDTVEQADKAVQILRERLHGEFTRH